jgi:hypothetical protein
MILQRLSREPIFARNKDAALNMLTSRWTRNCDDPLLKLTSFPYRRETMSAFLRLLEERYGGVEVYVQRYCNLTFDDIDIIRRNLVVEMLEE